MGRVFAFLVSPLLITLAFAPLIGMSIVYFALPLLLAIPAALLVVTKVQKRKPSWSIMKTAIASALPAVAVIAILLGWAFLEIVSRPVDPEYPDAGGMAIGAFLTLTPFYLLTVLGVGMTTILLSRDASD